METFLPVVSDGPAVDVEVTSAQAIEIRLTSNDLRRRMGLDFDPLLIDEEAGELRVVGIAGAMKAGPLALEIQPTFMEHDPRWRVEFLRCVAQVENLEWRPEVKPGRERRSLPDLLGMVVDHGLLRALTDGVPRRYHDAVVTSSHVRGQLDISQVWKRAVDPGAIACRVSQLDQDNEVLSSLKWVAAELAESAHLPWLREELTRFSEHWPEASAELPPPAIVETMQVPPQFGYLGDAIEVVRLVSRAPFVGIGRAGGRALVWRTSDVLLRYDRDLKVSKRAVIS